MSPSLFGFKNNRKGWRRFFYFNNACAAKKSGFFFSFLPSPARCLKDRGVNLIFSLSFVGDYFSSRVTACERRVYVGEAKFAGSL